MYRKKAMEFGPKFSISYILRKAKVIDAWNSKKDCYLPRVSCYIGQLNVYYKKYVIVTAQSITCTVHHCLVLRSFGSVLSLTNLF